MNGVAPWAWGWPGSTIDQGDWETAYPDSYIMYPSFEKGFNLQEQTADQWGAHGYAGMARDIKAKPNGSYRWTGEFIYNAS